MLHNSRYEVDKFLIADANERHNGIAKANQELIDNIKTMDNFDLLKLFTEYILKYNPQDEAIVEGYQKIVEEVLSRMTDVV